MLEIIKEAGVWGMVVPALAFVALFEAMIALGFSNDLKKGPVFSVAACGSALMVFVLGAVGTLNNRESVNRALASVGDAPGSKLAILYQGHLEARQVSLLALIFGVIPLLLAAVAVVRSRKPNHGPELSLINSAKDPSPPNPLGVLGFALIGMAALAAAGNFVLWNQPLPGKKLNHLDVEMIDGLARAEADPEMRCTGLSDLASMWAEPLGQSAAPLTDEQLRVVLDAFPGAREIAARCARSQVATLGKSSALLRLLTPEARAQWETAQSQLKVEPVLMGSPSDALKDVLGTPAKDEEPPAPEVDREALRPVLQKNRAAVTACYERGLKTNATLAGALKVEMHIAADGRVTAATPVEVTLKDEAVVKCIVGVFTRAKFPKLPRDTVVRQQFNFKAAE